ncbi:unnamed protein product [Leptidea sinapis]|uniref:Rad51-like C-terminal domain-containing protein n=1 Tax=Leptidea sinapis TaxID=189913 RepID=A0A5E4R2L8_9NEOP|nr:unnamed protein product [Leptidea sinapis]
MIINAAGLWQKETSLPTIATFSRSLDNVLGNNGIQLGSITEVLGLSGTGKTQLCCVRLYKFPNHSEAWRQKL